MRTLAALRSRGATCAVVERWNAYAKVRVDLFGFADLLAMVDTKIIAIQCTSGDNHAARKAKILANEHAATWLECGGKIELWSWRKLLAKPGGKAKRWQPRIEEITGD